MGIRSLFWHRNKDVVLFGAWFGKRFADNSRNLFQYLAENKEKYGLKHVVWITDSKNINEMLNCMGYECFMKDSKESIHFHKIAKYHFICESHNDLDSKDGDILGEYSYGAYKINLWHGSGAFKKVKYACVDKESSLIQRIKKRMHTRSRIYRLVEEVGGWGEYYILSSSKACTIQWHDFFQLPDDKYIESNLPRNLKPLRYTEREKEIISILLQYKKIILYLPTFRSSNSSFDIMKTTDNVLKYLDKNGILWVQKEHFVAGTSKNDNLADTNILTLESEFDINVIIDYANIIITDYSSVATDALYYRKPLIFYVPDIDEYNKSDRGFVDGCFQRFNSGRTVKNSQELIDAIRDLDNNEILFNEYYEIDRNKWWEYEKDDYDTIWNKIIERCTERN